MKYLIPVLCAVLLLTGCAKKDPGVEAPQPVVEAPKVVIDADELEERGGLAYFEEKPYTGVAVRKYPNRQKSYEYTYKDGKAHGLWTSWYENGQKSYEATFKDSKAHGLVTMWHENGQMNLQVIWKDGKSWTALARKPNGEKCPDTNLKKGNGTLCQYHENGQKHIEVTFKDGKQISRKGWDEDGNPF